MAFVSTASTSQIPSGSISQIPLAKCWITGAAGFIGSYLARFFIREGIFFPEEILLIDESKDFLKRPCLRGLPLAQMSFLEIKELEKLILKPTAKNLPQVVFHMGASSSTEEMRLDFLKTVNVESSQKIWKFCSQNSIKLVYASSAATYGNGEHGFSDRSENFSKLQPLNPYGRSKLEFDIWVLNQVALKLAPPQWTGLRFFNVYGPGEDHKGSQASVVFHARRQILKNDSLNLFMSHKDTVPDGEQKRDFVFVGDIAKLCKFFIEDKNWQSGIFNVGTGSAQTFLELGQSCFSALGKKPQIQFIPTPEALRKHYQYFTQADLTRLKNLTGFTEPFLDLKEGVKRTFFEMAALEF